MCTNYSTSCSKHGLLLHSNTCCINTMRIYVFHYIHSQIVQHYVLLVEVWKLQPECLHLSRNVFHCNPRRRHMCKNWQRQNKLLHPYKGAVAFVDIYKNNIKHVKIRKGNCINISVVQLHRISLRVIYTFLENDHAFEGEVNLSHTIIQTRAATAFVNVYKNNATFTSNMWCLKNQSINTMRIYVFHYMTVGSVAPELRQTSLFETIYVIKLSRHFYTESISIRSNS